MSRGLRTRRGRVPTLRDCAADESPTNHEPRTTNSPFSFPAIPIFVFDSLRPIVWYNSCVKMILAIALLLASSALLALSPVVLSLPPVVFDDAETTTNAPFVAWREDVREFSFSLECMGRPEDNV